MARLRAQRASHFDNQFHTDAGFDMREMEASGWVSAQLRQRRSAARIHEVDEQSGA